jgi:hypothetical protein
MVWLTYLIGCLIVAIALGLIVWPLVVYLQDLRRHRDPWVIVPWERHCHAENQDDFHFLSLSPNSVQVLVFRPEGQSIRLARDPKALAPVYVVPIRYSDEDAGFVVSAQVGESIMDLVLDSGSANISVASSDCVASNQCGSVAVGYDPSISSSAVDLKMEDTLNYASLELKAKKYLDTLQFFASTTGIDDLCGRRTWSTRKPTTRLQLTDTPVASASRMDGTHSNIIGLMQGSGFLKHMFSQSNTKPQWGLVCHQKSPWFVIGPIDQVPCVDPKLILWMPLSQKFHYMGAYVLDITGIRVNGVALSQKDGPQFAIIDTGTAESYWSPPACLGTWRPEDFDSRNPPTIDYDFKTEDKQGWRMTWTPQHYVEAGRTTLHGDNPNVSRLFPTQRVMILGIAHMMGLYWHFDLENNRVGVCPWT